MWVLPLAQVHGTGALRTGTKEGLHYEGQLLVLRHLTHGGDGHHIRPRLDGTGIEALLSGDEPVEEVCLDLMRIDGPVRAGGHHAHHVAAHGGRGLERQAHQAHDEGQEEAGAAAEAHDAQIGAVGDGDVGREGRHDADHDGDEDQDNRDGVTHGVVPFMHVF